MSPALRALLSLFFRTHSWRSGLEKCRQLRGLWILVVPGLRWHYAYGVVDVVDVVDEVDNKARE